MFCVKIVGGNGKTRWAGVLECRLVFANEWKYQANVSDNVPECTKWTGCARTYFYSLCFLVSASDSFYSCVLLVQINYDSSWPELTAGK